MAAALSNNWDFVLLSATNCDPKHYDAVQPGNHTMRYCNSVIDDAQKVIGEHDDLKCLYRIVEIHVTVRLRVLVRADGPGKERRPGLRVSLSYHNGSELHQENPD